MEKKAKPDNTLRRAGNKNQPLEAAIDRYLLAQPGGPGPLRMHVPGHKGGPGAPPSLLARWGEGVFADDLTEVPGLDDLAAPSGAIAHSQATAARRLGAGAVHYLVQGTTGGLVALALATARACGGGGRVLMPRHVHRALVAAVVLAGLDPVFVPMSFDGGIPCGVDPGVLRTMLDAADSAGSGNGCEPIVAVFDTYPNIFGAAHDLAAIVDACRRHRVPLFVDGAHAGLFGLDPLLPPAPLGLGADAAVISAHKTMGSLGQSSLLLLRESESGRRPDSYRAELAAALRLVQTTSPSYPLLLSLEAAVRHVTRPGGRTAIRRAARAGLTARRGLERLGVQCWRPGRGSPLASDPMRLVIDTIRLGRDGFAAAKALRTAGVQVEGADWRSLLVVFGPGDGPPESQRLVDAVATLMERQDTGRRVSAEGEAGAAGAAGARLSRLYEQTMICLPARALGPREAWFQAGRKVPLRDAAGLVATEPLAPYPPGVPVVWPGEVLSVHAIELITWVLRMGGSAHGLYPGQGPGEDLIKVLGGDRGA
jgi:arginine/lysine/ornithine decarboxylase